MKRFVLSKADVGFTLVEVLIAASLTVVAGYLILGIFLQTDKTFRIQNNKVSQGLSLADSTEAITDLIKISNAVVPQYTVGSTTYVSGSNTLVLSLPSIDASGNNMSTTYDFAVVTADSTNNKILRLRTFPAAASIRKSQNRVLATNLSKLNFFYYDNNGNVTLPGSAVRVNVTINTSELSAYSSTSSSSSDVNLRNN